jgi:hypothetical protein
MNQNFYILLNNLGGNKMKTKIKEVEIVDFSDMNEDERENYTYVLIGKTATSQSQDPTKDMYLKFAKYFLEIAELLEIEGCE